MPLIRRLDIIAPAALSKLDTSNDVWMIVRQHYDDVGDLAVSGCFQEITLVYIYQAVLLDQPRVISASVGHAWDLPEGTFGAAYAKFMGSRNFSPDDRPPVRFMDTGELAYVATRAREVHDFWHVLFGLPTNLIGESALKVIEFEQMFLPMCFLSVIGGSVKFNEKQRALFFQHYFPWATRAGIRCTDLMGIYYERHFHENLEDVRRKWGIIPAPNPSRTHQNG